MRQLFQWTLAALVVWAGGVSSGECQLIPQTTAARYGLKRAWFAQVGSPLTAGALDHVSYDNGMVLVQSSRGMLTAIDAETGRTLWSVQVGSQTGSTSEPAANDEHVVVLNGSTLYVVDRAHGDILWERRVHTAPGAGPGITATHVFVPMVSGLVEGFDLAQGAKQTPWHYQSTGRVLIPPMTTASTVSWATEKGYLYVADPAGAGIRYRLETSGAIYARPASWAPRLFAGSVDGFVYAIDEAKGSIDWKHSIGEAVYARPVAIEGKVFAMPEFGGLYCLDAERGDLLWHAVGVKQFVSASPTRVYAEDEYGRLAILDGQTGTRLATLPTSGLTTKLVNSQSDRVFIVDDSCVIQCLHETALRSPVIYTPPAVPQTDRKLPKKPADDSASETLAEPEADSPLDAPVDDDNPFEAFDDDNPFDTAP